MFWMFVLLVALSVLGLIWGWSVYSVIPPGRRFLDDLTMGRNTRVAAVLHVGGPHHSGTTLLRRMLGVHPRSVEVVRERAPTRMNVGGVIMGSSGWVPEGADACSVDAKSGLRGGGCFLVFKNPTNTRSATKGAWRIFREFSGAVHVTAMVRDPREIAWSLYKRDEDKYGDVGKELQNLKDILDTLVIQERKYAPEMSIVKYERLIRQPEAVLRAICERTHLPYDPSMLNFNEHKAEYATDPHAPVTEGVAEQTTRPDDKNHQDLRTWQINQGIFDRGVVWEKEAPEHIKNILKGFSFDYDNYPSL